VEQLVAAVGLAEHRPEWWSLGPCMVLELEPLAVAASKPGWLTLEWWSLEPYTMELVLLAAVAASSPG